MTSPSLPKTIIKKGRRTYGAIYRLPSGSSVYLAYRNTGEIYRSGETSISAAIRAKKACWAIDDQTVLEMKARGVPYIGVYCRDNEDVWLTAMGEFFNKDHVRVMNFTGRGGSLQRFLPLQRFRRRPGLLKRL